MVPSPCPANLKLVEATDDVREIYSQTRVLLVPSKWESFGRVAVEAAYSGIPVIASPNPGSFEALHTAAIYARPSEPDEWVQAIRSLQDPDTYSRASRAVLDAANRLDSHSELAALETELKKLVTRGRCT